MNTLLAILNLLSIAAGIVSVAISTWTLKTKAYQRYTEKINEFEKHQRKIKEEIKNDRRKFE